MSEPAGSASTELRVVARDDALVVEDGDETTAAIPVAPDADADRPVTTSYVHSIGTEGGRRTATFATDPVAAAAHAEALLATDENDDGWRGESPTSVTLLLHEAAVEGEATESVDASRVDAVHVVAVGDRLDVAFAPNGVEVGARDETAVEGRADERPDRTGGRGH